MSTFNRSLPRGPAFYNMSVWCHVLVPAVRLTSVTTVAIADSGVEYVDAMLCSPAVRQRQLKRSAFPMFCTAKTVRKS